MSTIGNLVLLVGFLICGMAMWRVRRKVWAIGMVFLWGVVPLSALSFAWWACMK